MKKIFLDNNIVNNLIDDQFKENELYRYFESLSDTKKIEIYGIPTNIIEIFLCSNTAKRHSLSKAFLKLIDGQRLDFSWDVHLISLIFESIDEKIPGVLKNKYSIYQLSAEYNRMLLGLLGLLSSLPNYSSGNFNSIVKEKLINEYYQARFLKDPDYYLKIYKLQLKGEHPDEKEIADQEHAESLSVFELNKLISELKVNKSRIKNIKEFSKIKNELGIFFAKIETKRLLLNFFPYKELIEDAIDFKLLIKNWKTEFLDSKPNYIKPEINVLFLDPNSNPSKQAYEAVLFLLTERLELEKFFPFKNLLSLYLFEVEKILNNTKDTSKGLILDIEYFPTALKADHFITADKELFENMQREMKNLGFDESKILFYHNKKWKGVLEN